MRNKLQEFSPAYLPGSLWSAVLRPRRYITITPLRCKHILRCTPTIRRRLKPTLPLHRAERHPGAAGTAVVRRRTNLFRVWETYAERVTPTEVRVLLAIVEIGGAPQVAETLGIGEGTVKTHLKRLYQKTGAHRQADLVKLFAGYANPLLG